MTHDDDLISRKAAIEALKEHLGTDPWHVANIATRECIDILESLPAAAPVLGRCVCNKHHCGGPPDHETIKQEGE